MVSVMFVGNVEAIAGPVRAVAGASAIVDNPYFLRSAVMRHRPNLIIVAGWRHLIPPDVLAVPRLGVVGFHSAKLPEYPGRAPVPWALLRGDSETANTMLYLDEGIDTGDIIATRTIPIIGAFDTPEKLNREMGLTAADMLTAHLTGLLAGTAPRTPQDTTRRGPLTTTEGWALWNERQRLAAGHG